MQFTDEKRKMKKTKWGLGVSNPVLVNYMENIFKKIWNSLTVRRDKSLAINNIPTYLRAV